MMGFGPTLSHPPPPSASDGTTTTTPTITPSSSGSVDIGGVVAGYSKMVELLYPLELAGTVILYITRWENYLLTLVTLLLLCVLFYYPALLAGFLVGSAIVGMAVGKYYGQTKLSASLRLRRAPQVNHLDEDDQALRRCNKDQKAAHKLLLEYKQIICNAEALITLVTRTLEYVYRIILWKSLEVSLCVTVLLCVLFTLVCTVYLRVLSACLPLIILCFNRHFIKRTVELWRSLFGYLYGKVRLKRREGGGADSKERTQGTAGGGGGGGGDAAVEVVHHSDDTPPLEDGVLTPELEEGRNGRGSEPRQAGRAGGGGAGAVAGGGGGGGVGAVGGSWTEVGAEKDGGSAPHNTKGYCYKCNTSFAKLLKRKHDCNYCGQTCCGSCTVKVKRALLGATSPAAFEESVRVCVDCKSKLDELKLSEISIPAS